MNGEVGREEEGGGVWEVEEGRVEREREEEGRVRREGWRRERWKREGWRRGG